MTALNEKRGSKTKITRSLVLIILSSLMFAAMLICYVSFGITSFSPSLSAKIIALTGICVLLGIILIITEIKTAKYALYLMGLWTWLEYIVSQMSFISNVLVGIDGNQFTIGFILTFVTGLLAWFLALLSAISQKNEVGHVKNTEALSK